MLKKIRRLVLVIAVLATFTSGCRSTQEYERLAKAGSAYAIAVNKLLEVRGDIRIDTTSEELLDYDRTNRDFFTRIDPNYYRQSSDQDIKQLDILARIQKHNQLLSRYFLLLGELATSNAPQQAQAGIDNIVSNLATVSNELKPLVTNRRVPGVVTRLIVSGKIRRALKTELEKRKDTIQTELILQQQLLDLLAEQIEDNLKSIRENQEKRLIIIPLNDEEPINNQDEWIATRREILRMETTAKELQDASDTASEFRAVFEEFVSGRLTTTRINYFLNDVNKFLDVVEISKK